MNITPARTLQINNSTLGSSIDRSNQSADINKIKSQKKLTPIAPKEKSQFSEHQLQDIIKNMQVLADNTLQTKMNFSVDKDTNNIVIKIIEKNGDSEKIIKQIPAEEMLEMHKKMKELTGFFLNENI